MGTPGNHRVDSEIRYSLNDGNWEPLELGQFISLIEPSPGEYRFQLETLSSAVSGSKRTFTLTKLPHFYATCWFNVLVLLAVAGAIGGFFRYREDILRNEKRIRIKLDSDSHDEVGRASNRIYFQAA